MGRFDPLPTDPYQHPPDHEGGGGWSGYFGPHCAACRQVTRLGTKFCTACNALREDAERGHTVRYAASRWMRFWSRLLDTLLVVVTGLVIYFVAGAAGLIAIDLENTDHISLAEVNACTLIATGLWFLWFAIIAKRGQTPGKQILGLRIIRDDGEAAPTQLNWLREGAFQLFLILPSLLGEPIVNLPDVVTGIVGWTPFVALADVCFIWGGPDRQTLHDRIFKTLVVRVQPVREHSAALRPL